MAKRRALILTIAVALAAGTGGGQASPGSTNSAAAREPTQACSPAEQKRRQQALAAFKRQMATRRAAYFKTHKSAQQRRAFVRRQQARLKALQRRAAACRPAPPPRPPPPARDGSIAFQGFDPDTGSYEVFVVRPDGSGLTNVTAAADSEETEPSWSPDGRRIAFMSTRSGGISGAPAIYVMNTDGSGVRQLVPGGLEQTSPSWSPDGRWIAFSRCTFITESGVCSSAQIAVVRPDGQGARNVTQPIAQVSVTDSKPAWSPDGTRMVFTRTLSFGENQIWVVDADGKGVRRLLHDDSESDHNPSWSPDGRRIVFSSDAPGTDAIFIMNADGTGVQKLIDEFKDPDDPDATIGGGAVNPAFSPSGTRIVFSASGDLWTMNLSGQDLVRLTESGGDEPDWARAP